MSEQPFLCAVMLKKPLYPGADTFGARAILEWAESADALRGRLCEKFIAEGWSIEMLEVQPISQSTIDRLGSESAAAPKAESDG